MNENEKLLLKLLSVIFVVLAFLTVVSRELYYGAYPHLRPQDSISAGTVSVCDLNCAVRRIDKIEARLGELESRRP